MAESDYITEIIKTIHHKTAPVKLWNASQAADRTE